MQQPSSPLVLVTGASGYIATYCILELLRQGYRVRGTLRSAARADEVRRRMTVAFDKDPGSALTFAEADLSTDAGWPSAMEGVSYVLHVASPLPADAPKDPEAIIGPARDGTLRVLRAAHDAGVLRVVQTSSTAAIAYGSDDPGASVFTEEHWNDPDHRDNSAYTRSKVIAERAAWQELERLASRMEWVVVNPALVLGPVFDADASASVAAVSKLLRGELPGLPRFGYPVVDVRDLAALHVRLMTDPAAAGQRYLAGGEFLWLEDIAVILRDRLGASAERVPTRRLPNALVRLAALFDPIVRGQLFELGKKRRVSSKKAEEAFGWKTRDAALTIVDTANSLLALAE